MMDQANQTVEVVVEERASVPPTLEDDVEWKGVAAAVKAYTGKDLRYPPNAAHHMLHPFYQAELRLLHDTIEQQGRALEVSVSVLTKLRASLSRVLEMVKERRAPRPKPVPDQEPS